MGGHAGCLVHGGARQCVAGRRHHLYNIGQFLLALLVSFGRTYFLGSGRPVLDFVFFRKHSFGLLVSFALPNNGQPVTPRTAPFHAGWIDFCQHTGRTKTEPIVHSIFWFRSTRQHLCCCLFVQLLYRLNRR